MTKTCQQTKKGDEQAEDCNNDYLSTNLKGDEHAEDCNNDYLSTNLKGD